MDEPRRRKGGEVAEERLFLDSKGRLALWVKPKLTFFRETPDLRGLISCSLSVVRLTDEEVALVQSRMKEQEVAFYEPWELSLLDREKRITIETLALIGRANFNRMIDLGKKPRVPIDQALSGF